MVRSDFDPIINDSDDIVTFPSVSAHGDHAHLTHDDDFESSAHDRFVPPPVYNNYAFAIGVNGLILGFVTTVAGLLQIFGFPMLCSSGDGAIVFSLDTFYGFTLWCGIALTITSATGLRSTVTKRQSTINRFLAAHIFTTLFYLSSAVIMIVAFTRGSLLNLDVCMTAGHAISAGFICLGVVLQMIIICSTYETIFDGKTTSLLRCCINSTINRCCPRDELELNNDTTCSSDDSNDAKPSPVNW